MCRPSSSSQSASAAPAATRAPNNNTPHLLQRLHQADVTLSKLIFQLALPWPLEFLLSLPGNLLGPPFLQIVGPLWMMALHHHQQHHPYETTSTTTTSILEEGLWMAALGATTVLLLLPWIFFLKGHTWILPRIFFSHISFALSPLIGMGISQYSLLLLTAKHNADDASDDHHHHITRTPALCFHFLMLYNASCIVVLFLKHGTLRQRPCCTCEQYISRKHFPMIPRILAQTAPDTSFPSGDVMSATCLAVSLANLHLAAHHDQRLWLPAVGVVMVLLTALGRMYFLAHHFCDTLVGMAIPGCLHMLCLLSHNDNSSWLPAVGTAQWYHPLGAFLGLVVASRFRRGDQK